MTARWNNQKLLQPLGRQIPLVMKEAKDKRMPLKRHSMQSHICLSQFSLNWFTTPWRDNTFAHSHTYTHSENIHVLSVMERHKRTWLYINIQPKKKVHVWVCMCVQKSTCVQSHTGKALVITRSVKIDHTGINWERNHALSPRFKGADNKLW